MSDRTPVHQDLYSRDTSKGFGLSLIIHLAVASGILLKALVFPSPPLMILPSLRVDLVGLPDILKKDLAKVPLTPPTPDAALPKPAAPPPPAPMPIAKTEVAAPNELVLKPKANTAPSPAKEKRREKDLRSALDRIKAIEEIDDAQETQDAPKKGVPLIKGNKVSKGSSLDGEAIENDQSAFYQAVRTRLQDNWELPPWIARQNLSAQVRLFIDGRGRVTSLRFTKSSGNAQFDDAVKKAVLQSDPFTAPPSDIASGVLMNGILVGFPL